jgi:hypothetical protein
MRPTAWTLMALISLLVLASCSKEVTSGPVPAPPAPVPLEVRKFAKLDPAELGPCVAVDGGTDSNGALENLRSVLANASRHASIESAVDGLSKCGSVETGPIAIAGHGTSGGIYVGGGDKHYNDKTIYFDNDPVWAGHLKKIPGTQTLTLLSCNTGAGERGRRLLDRLAAHTQRRVRALNALVYCDPAGIYLEEGAEWNEAAPGLAAALKPRPESRNEPFDATQYVALGGERFSFDGVDAITARVFFRGEWNVVRADPEHFRGWLGLFDLAHPFRPPGVPLAPRTAEVDIRLADGAIERLIVYGDAVARDASGNYYDVSRVVEGDGDRGPLWLSPTLMR